MVDGNAGEMVNMYKVHIIGIILTFKLPFVSSVGRAPH